MKINMKKIINKLAIVYVLFTLLFIRKMLSTSTGLLLFVTTSILLMAFVLFINHKREAP